MTLFGMPRAARAPEISRANNGAVRPARGRERGRGGVACHHGVPASLRVDGVRHAHHLDVRPLLARGEEPFDTILRAADRLAGDEALHLITAVESRGLYAMMRRRGCSSYTMCDGPDFHVWFYRRAC